MHAIGVVKISVNLAGRIHTNKHVGIVQIVFIVVKNLASLFIKLYRMLLLDALTTVKRRTYPILIC